MSETITASLTVSGGDTITAQINTLARGPEGPAGSGTNAITSATTSDGTADLLLANVETATAEVTGTLIAPHIHGNLAGSLYAHVRAGENLAKGDPVYISSSHGSGSSLIAIVSKADASNAAKMPAVGIMDAAVANNANGHMVIAGTITELDTDGLAINGELYVAAGGGMTATPPTARAQPVARVERANANNGAILVKVNGLSASDATVSTLVRRDGSGGAIFVDVNTSTLTSAGIVTTGQVEFNGTDAGDSMTFNMVNYAYGTGAALAHRTALGSGATGDALFQAASPAAARTTLGFDEMISKIPFPISLVSDFSTTSTTFVNATGLSFSVEANKRYAVQIYLAISKNDVNGLQYQLTGPSAPVTVSVRALGSGTAATNSATTQLTAFSTASSTTNTYNGDGAVFGSGVIANGANAGTVQLQLRAVTGGTAKIYAGSWIQITEL